MVGDTFVFVSWFLHGFSLIAEQVISDRNSWYCGYSGGSVLSFLPHGDKALGQSSQISTCGRGPYISQSLPNFAVIVSPTNCVWWCILSTSVVPRRISSTTSLQHVTSSHAPVCILAAVTAQAWRTEFQFRRPSSLLQSTNITTWTHKYSHLQKTSQNPSVHLCFGP